MVLVYYLNTMGYTHYITHDRSKIDEQQFRSKRHKLCNTVRLVCNEATVRGIKLGNRTGRYRPAIDKTLIAINGSRGQPSNERVREQGSKPVTAASIQIANECETIAFMGTNTLQRPDGSFLDDSSIQTGSWYAGVKVSTPSVGTDTVGKLVNASYEPLVLLSDIQYRKSSIKTNYYPYDIVVTAILAATKLIMGVDAVSVKSDGTKKEWMRGLLLLRDVNPELGVEQFELDE